MDVSDIQTNYPAIRTAANEVLGLLGPGLTKKTEGHVETDIATAASLAGVSILRGKGFDLSGLQPGSPLFSDLDVEMNGIWNFMMAAAGTMGLEPSAGWDSVVPGEHKPLFSIPEMIQKTEKDFLAICTRHNLAKVLFPYVAVLAAIKLVFAADKMNLLDQKIGKALVGYHVVAGAKTVPYPLKNR